MDTAELIQAFKQQVKNFNTIEPRVREQLSASIQKSFAQSVEQVNERIEQIASEKMGRVTGNLNQAVNAVTQQLQYYEKQSAYSVYILLIVLFLGCLVSGFLVGKWAVPQPNLPLSTQDLQTYEHGLIMLSGQNSLKKSKSIY